MMVIRGKVSWNNDRVAKVTATTASLESRMGKIEVAMDKLVSLMTNVQVHVQNPSPQVNNNVTSVPPSAKTDQNRSGPLLTNR